MDIKVFFMGGFRLFVNDEQIFINQNKLNAVLAYIFYKNYCTRDELVNIFWGDVSEDRGRSNLRNALSRLKSIMKSDVLIVDNYTIKVNPSFVIERDIDKILDQNNTSFLEFEDYTFLHNHGVKDCDEFDDWVYGIRDAYDQIVLKNMNYQLSNQIKQNNNILIEEISYKIIKMDPYAETAYRALMKLYANKYEYTKSLKLFNDLKKILKDDLDVDVDNETKSIYENIKNNWESKGHDLKDLGFNRFNYISNIEYEYSRFIGGLEFKHCLLYGDIGVGKTEIANKFLADKDKEKLIRISLKSKHRKIKYYLINKILMEIGIKGCDIYSELNLKTILNPEIFKEKEKTIIFIKNLQYIDVESFELLESFLKLIKKANYFIIFEFCVTLCEDVYLLKRITRLPYVKDIEVLNLSYRDFQVYIADLNNRHNIDLKDSSLIEDIYIKTNGNLMYINESLQNLIEYDNKEIYELRSLRKIEFKLSLNEKELYIMQLIAASIGGLSFDCIEKNSNITILNLINIITKLEYRGILSTKTINNNSYIDFKYNSMKSEVYLNANTSLKEHIHSLLMNYHEETKYYFSDNYLEHLDNLIYHSKGSNNHDKFLKYEIMKLQYILNYYDEFYPNVENYCDIEDIKSINKKNIYDKFEETRRLLNNVIFTDENKKSSFYLILLFLEGRSLIKDGYCSAGQGFIERIIENKHIVDDENLIINCYLERIYYGLRVGNWGIMQSTIKVIRDDYSIKDLSLNGKLNRLEGLSYYIKGDFSKAIELLYMAIDAYNLHYKRENDVYGIAACYNYIGNSYRAINELDKAVESHKIAIKLCEKKELYKPLDEFYKDYAYTVFISKNFELARELCYISNNYYQSYASFWERSIVENVLSLIYIYENNYAKALKHHNSAEILINKSPTKNELILHNSVKDILAGI